MPHLIWIAFNPEWTPFHKTNLPGLDGGVNALILQHPRAVLSIEVLKGKEDASMQDWELAHVSSTTITDSNEDINTENKNNKKYTSATRHTIQEV